MGKKKIKILLVAKYYDAYIYIYLYIIVCTTVGSQEKEVNGDALARAEYLAFLCNQQDEVWSIQY